LAFLNCTNGRFVRGKREVLILEHRGRTGCKSAALSPNLRMKYDMTSRDPIQSMWADALALLEQAERMQRQYCQLGTSQPRGPTWEPPVDVFENGHELSVVVALPGVRPESVRVVVDGGALFVIGERPMPALARATVRRLEIPYGRFERHIDLPPGLFEIVRRELANGCLWLGLHKLG
jgi:HSP20 family molecular chaperone IbpA